MIYTVTVNPALDYVMILREMETGRLNRSSRELHHYGGKGINISIVLNNLGISSVCMGFVAGYVGKEIERGLNSRGCRTDFIHLEQGCTRINVKLKEAGGRETEINGNGPYVGEEYLEQMKDQVKRMKTGDLLILSGNVQKEIPAEFYAQLAEIAVSRKMAFIVDAEKSLLMPTLRLRPLLIKPNQKELEEMVGRKADTLSDLMEAADYLQEQGARNVMVSRGPDGAYFQGEDGSRYLLEAPKGIVINTVGSGDSMVAGFLSRYLQGETLLRAACCGVAAGSARAFSEQLPEKEAVEQYASEVGFYEVKTSGACPTGKSLDKRAETN